MKTSPMCKKSITQFSIGQIDTIHFRWVCDFNHYVSLMFHFLLQLHRKNLLMLNQKLIKILRLMSEFNTFASRYMTYQIKPMPSINNNMINIMCHIHFRWVTKFGYIYRNKSLSQFIGIFDPSNMILTPSLGFWETII